jgi:ubiquinone/menaquinone biosynthesis C-methylase UbiE
VELGAHDPFADVGSWDEATASEWAQRLDARAASPDQVRLRARILALAKPAPGESVLEVGCGTGALLEELARAVEPGGRAAGAEPQPELARAARARGLEVVEAFGEDLPFEDASIDLALVQTVLIHLPPATVRATLDELRRVVRAGGRLLAVEQDADTWTIDHPDRELTRRIVRFNSDQRSADGWRGRQLQRLLAEAGFEPTTRTFVHVDSSHDSYLSALCDRIALAAADAGAISADEAERWLAQLRGERFFSTINYVLCLGLLE